MNTFKSFGIVSIVATVAFISSPVAKAVNPTANTNDLNQTTYSATHVSSLDYNHLNWNGLQKMK